MMSSVLVTSTLQYAPPISSASADPFSSCRSATTTLAPRDASTRAAAAPIPDAPPVTIALTPLMSMEGDDNPDGTWMTTNGTRAPVRPQASKSER